MSSHHVGSLVIGPEADKKHRISQERKARRSLARIEAQRKRELQQAQRDMWAGDYLPKRGEKGAEAGRHRRRSYVAPWRTTMKRLRVLYPFLGEEGLGSEGMLIGVDGFTRASFCFDPWVLYEKGVVTNPNIALAGVIGTGKSALMKSLAVRAIATGRRVYVPGDVKGEWTAVAKAVGGITISPGGPGGDCINPLDEGVRPACSPEGTPYSDEAWAALVRSNRTSLLNALVSAMLGRELRPEEHTALETALDTAVKKNRVPILSHVRSELLAPSLSPEELPEGVETVSRLKAMGEDAGHSLRRLTTGDMAGIFDGQSTVSFDTNAPMITVDLSAFSTGSKLLPLLMTCTSAWMESSLRDPDSGQRFIIYDEAHRIMREAALLDRMKDHWKLSRAWGISNVLVLHRLSDLDAIGDSDSSERALAEGLLADTSTRIIYRQEKDQLASTASTLGLNSTATDLVSQFTRGQGLWLVGQRSFVVNHHLTRWEQELTDTDAAMRNN